MKNLIIVITLLLFSSCGTNLVYLTVNEPAPVSIPAHLKRIGIINRTIPSENNKLLNKLDQVLSEKGPELDLAGAEEEMRGVKDGLSQNSRFSQVLILQSKLRTQSPSTFPAPLSWDIVEKMCKENGVDGLFCLELFYTDSKVSYSMSPTTVKTPLGNVNAVEHHASMVTTVKSGWRIYDPYNKRIVDEYPFTESLTFQGSGINPIAAGAALLGRKEAVKQTGYKGGQSYAYRILPYSTRVSREYYVKGNNNFKVATRMARIGKWDDAAVLWKKETTNESEKIAGRACYNMAIINEINGNLEAAIDWAQKSYVTSNKKLTLRYVNILKNRRARNGRLQQQLEDSESN